MDRIYSADHLKHFTCHIHPFTQTVIHLWSEAAIQGAKVEFLIIREHIEHRSSLEISILLKEGRRAGRPRDRTTVLSASG